jgi:hypothetical protein
MRTNIFTMLLLVGYAVGLAWPVMADEDKDTSTTSHAIMVDEDYFSSGSSAELDKRVDGEAFLARRANWRCAVRSG